MVLIPQRIVFFFAWIATGLYTSKKAILMETSIEPKATEKDTTDSW
jgi:hypothetical protein